LGHAAAAYAGFVAHPERAYLWETLEDERVVNITRAAMWESGRALIAEYPAEFDRANQGEHIEDLLRRFRNRRLADTVYRVGRDLFRKLGPGDRVIGALRLQIKHGVAPKGTTAALAAGLLFRAADDAGKLFEDDARFAAVLGERGPQAMLFEVCGLDPGARAEGEVIERVTELYERLRDESRREIALSELAQQVGATSG
ncbi:MAG: hypothetical protein JSV65_07015, partial [Armatimonadota bacterium]